VGSCSQRQPVKPATPISTFRADGIAVAISPAPESRAYASFGSRARLMRHEHRRDHLVGDA
jgi:hypothetical protein